MNPHLKSGGDCLMLPIHFSFEDFPSRTRQLGLTIKTTMNQLQKLAPEIKVRAINPKMMN